jgi:TetR/AcrR family transcriptional regulator, transcriptional repressor for nem operon
MPKPESSSSAKTKLLDAALAVIRSKGYTATTVDELCAVAGVTKGAFFHHFKSKEDLAVSAAQYWSTVTDALFESAPYHRHSDPLKRLLGYIDFRKELLKGSVPEFTCLVGTMVQEAFDSSPAIRDACHKSIFGHSANVARDIEEARKLYQPRASWTAESLALHIQAVIQGAFILAKSDPKSSVGVGVAADSIVHLRRYIEFLFKQESVSQKQKLS